MTSRVLHAIFCGAVSLWVSVAVGYFGISVAKASDFHPVWPTFLYAMVLVVLPGRRAACSIIHSVGAFSKGAFGKARNKLILAAVMPIRGWGTGSLISSQRIGS